MRSYDVDDLLQIVEFQPPTKEVKPWIRRGLFEPQKREYRNAGRVLAKHLSGNGRRNYPKNRGRF